MVLCQLDCRGGCLPTFLGGGGEPQYSGVCEAHYDGVDAEKDLQFPLWSELRSGMEANHNTFPSNGYISRSTFWLSSIMWGIDDPTPYGIICGLEPHFARIRETFLSWSLSRTV